MENVLRAEGLEKSYGGRKVVDNVSFFVEPGEVVGILGPNGAGKTTSFYAVVGLVKPDNGKVFIGSEEITNRAMHERAKKGIGYLPQEASVFRDLSVEDNIAAILELQPLNKSEQSSRLEELIEEFGLEKVRKSMGKVRRRAMRGRGDKGRRGLPERVRPGVREVLEG